MLLLIIVFALGYMAIVLEAPLRLSKTSAALVMGVACWTVYIADHNVDTANHLLTEHFAGIAEIAFFLLGAMTIVELIDAHDGFHLITSRITTTKRRQLLLIVAALSFVLSAILDNLTTSIVMVSLVRKLAADEHDRLMLGGVIVISANAGGVWSPIGDVTTTMLWIDGQVTTLGLVEQLVIPALVCVAIPVLWVSLRFRGHVTRPEVAENHSAYVASPGERTAVFLIGTGALLGVPVFKTLTGLPPVMGMLLGLGMLWAITEFIHKRKPAETRVARSAAAALQRVDSQSVLFFVGILLAIGALESSGILESLAHHLEVWIGNVDTITVTIGLSSSVIDNVPLVAASQGMYPLTAFPVDHHFWLFLAYCAGTGGSILIIGSAAGIAVMGIQRVTFGWYVKHFSLPALLGYFGGALAYLAIHAL